MRDLPRQSIIYCIAVSFFGGFLGALGVAAVKYLLAVMGFTQLNVSLQWLQNFSWGGAIWGFIPAIFLIARKGNVYLLSLLTMFVAVSYDLFVLQGFSHIYYSTIIFECLINLIYALILAITIIKAKAIVKHKFIFKNLLPKPTEINKFPKQFFKCPHCKRQFEKIQDLEEHMHHHQ